jgi:hypothetical protein
MRVQHLVVAAGADASACARVQDGGMNLAGGAAAPGEKRKLIPRFSLHA